MEEYKFNELLDIVRRLNAANSPDDEIKDVIESLTKYDELTTDQKQELDFIMSLKSKADIPASSTLGYFAADYF